MPFNIWCNTCGEHIAQGVRFNAEKKQVRWPGSTWCGRQPYIALQQRSRFFSAAGVAASHTLLNLYCTIMAVFFWLVCFDMLSCKHMLLTDDSNKPQWVAAKALSTHHAATRRPPTHPHTPQHSCKALADGTISCSGGACRLAATFQPRYGPSPCATTVAARSPSQQTPRTPSTSSQMVHGARWRPMTQRTHRWAAFGVQLQLCSGAVCLAELLQEHSLCCVCVVGNLTGAATAQQHELHGGQAWMRGSAISNGRM